MCSSDLEAAARVRGHARRIALAVLITAVALPSAARFAPDTSLVYKQALALQKAIDAFAADERRLSADFEAMAKRARDKNLDEKATLSELREKLIPAWNDAVARLSALELDARAPMRGDYESLLRYAQARRDMTVALADFLEAGTPASRQAFIDKRTATEAALKDYQIGRAHV